jgi:hypothetical protein
MIRRGFWLATGAALGVLGYRRVTGLARGLGFPLDGQLAAGQNGLHDDSRQVRGNDNLTGRPRHRAPARSRGGLGSVVSAAVFVRDVREGMAEYRSLNREKLARTLGSRSAPAAAGGSGASEQHASER